LSVRAVVAPEAGVTLVADLRREGRPADALVAEGEEALARYLRGELGLAALEPETTRPAPRPGAADAGIQLAPEEGAAAAEARTSAEVRDLLKTLPPEAVSAPIVARDAVISVSTGDWTLVTGEERNAAVITGGVTVESDEVRTGRSLQITGQRAV